MIMKISHYIHCNASLNNRLCKSYDGQTRWMYFLIENDDLLENIILFGIKAALI